MYGGDSTLTNSGKIIAGKNADGTYANAILMTGGNNTLILEKGYEIKGNVAARSAGSTFALGGSDNASLDVSKIDDGTNTKQYQGFDNTKFKKQGISEWELTGTNNETLTWTISEGKLSVTDDSNLGGVNGKIIFDGGTLKTKETSNTSRGTTLTGNGAIEVVTGKRLLTVGIFMAPVVLVKQVQEH